LFVASALVVAMAGCDITAEPKSTVTDATIFDDEASYRAFLAKLYAGLTLTGQQGPDGNADFGRLDEVSTTASYGSCKSCRPMKP
jgi:hypothetical protein